MPERPDLRHIARDIRESLADYDRDALVEILSYVFKEYVIEGAPDILLGRMDTVDELTGLSFPELIRLLQTRLPNPELELFVVQDDVVLVRAGGALTPLTEDQVPRRRPQERDPLPSETEPSSAPRASVEEARLRGRGDLAGGSRGAVMAPPPRPVPSAAPAPRGVSISGRAVPTPSGGPPPTAPPQAATPTPASSAAPPPPASPPAAAAPDDGKKPAEGDDAASIRFSLLELD